MLRALVLSAVLVPFGAGAPTYEFTFERSNVAFDLRPVDFFGSGAPYVGGVSEQPGYRPLFKVTLHHDGALDGLTFDMASLERRGLHRLLEHP